MGNTFYHLALRPLMGPMCIPKFTVRLENPQVQYSPVSIPTCGTIPLPSEGLLTWTYPLKCTLSISKRTSALKNISTSIMVTMTSKTQTMKIQETHPRIEHKATKSPKVQHSTGSSPKLELHQPGYNDQQNAVQ